MDRFWSKVSKSDKCWEWTAATNKHGYGTFQFEGRLQKAHRVAWQLSMGSVPDGLFVLHRCDNPSCVRLTHLFLGTQRDNVRDAMRKGRYRGGRPKVNATHCPHGHHFTKANTYVDRRGYKVCVACKNASKVRGSLRSKTHCRHGHLWKKNARTDSNGYRVCATCRRVSLARYYRRSRGLPSAVVSG
jgi:hypothetical protein